uniref:Mos1 transposase HTH domain-containing protein n=1 Tax=Erpetoichthys calabaricus TaxID=27687 RepID=A0A8C4RS43_ERPCA
FCDGILERITCFIKFCFLLGKTATEAVTMLQDAFKEEVLSKARVFSFNKQFKWGRESFEDDPHTGWPVEATSTEMCRKVEDLILSDRWIKVSQIDEEMGISADTLWKIIHEQLGIFNCKEWNQEMEGHSLCLRLV